MFIPGESVLRKFTERERARKICRLLSSAVAQKCPFVYKTVTYLFIKILSLRALNR